VSTPRKGGAWKDRIGLVLQDSDFDPLHTVTETVKLFAGFFSHPRSVAETLELVGLSDKASTRIGRLSGGQRRRVDVALGIIGSPELLFLDEPTTGFDPSARREFWTMLEGLRSAGTSILLTTHYMEEAQHLCDRIAILAAVASSPRARRRHSSRWPVRRRCDSASSTDSTSGPCRESRH